VKVIVARIITGEVIDQVLRALRAAEATEKRKAQATADDRGDTGGKPDNADGKTSGADETTGTDDTRTDEQPAEDGEIPF
jgi:cobalamin biosynthesis protein CobT